MRMELPRITEDVRFFKTYIPSILRDRLKNIDEERKELIESYLLSKLNILRSYNDLIDYIIDSLVIIVGDTVCDYMIDSIEFVDGKASLNSLVSLLNYGSLDIRRLNIFTDVFDYIRNNLTKIYRKYSRK